MEAAVALTGHAVLVVADDVTDERLLALGVHGFGGAHDPRATVALADGGEIGVLDVLLLRHGTAPAGRDGGAPGPDRTPAVVPRPDLADSARAVHAGQWRDDVQVLGLADPSSIGLVTLSRGIAGLTEVGLQAEDGGADQLLHGALARVPEEELVLASVTPGNARSLRFFLRRGFVPVGSVQQWRPRRRR